MQDIIRHLANVTLVRKCVFCMPGNCFNLLTDIFRRVKRKAVALIYVSQYL